MIHKDTMDLSSMLHQMDFSLSMLRGLLLIQALSSLSHPQRPRNLASGLTRISSEITRSIFTRPGSTGIIIIMGRTRRQAGLKASDTDQPKIPAPTPPTTAKGPEGRKERLPSPRVLCLQRQYEFLERMK